MIRKFVVVLMLAAVPLATVAREPADNPRLTEMYEADQAVRKTHPIDWSKVAPMDRAHQQEAVALLRQGEVRTAADYFHAAMIMQHAEAFEDYQLAFSLARIGYALDPSNKHARWLSAAAWDRALMSKGVPQWYATQYRPTPAGAMELYPVVESVVTDAERAALGVPTLQEAKDMVMQVGR